MLVLSRRQHERIVIGVPPSNQEQLIELEIVGIRPKQTMVGLIANKEIIILRKELVNKPQNKN